MTSSNYHGRFAPSPTGPLHFGSLAAAVGSYLDARKHHGTWLVRMEDLDTPRCVPGAADDILYTLEAFGLCWDGEIIYQSRRIPAYEETLQQLRESGAAYPCCCTRKEIADSALHGIDGPVYPGTCRHGIPAGREGRAWRVRTDHSFLPPCNGETRMGVEQSGRGVSTPSPTLPLQGGGNIQFDDALQGRVVQHLENEIGDFVIKRADGLFAYQLAVVVDDAFQNITHIVRGADLLHSTPRQIYLQRLLGLNTPAYMHLPIAVNAQGFPVCLAHRDAELGEMKCVCGEPLDAQKGKFGVFFTCLNCGPMTARKAFEVNAVKDVSKRHARPNQKTPTHDSREMTVRSDDPRYFD